MMQRRGSCNPLGIRCRLKKRQVVQMNQAGEELRMFCNKTAVCEGVEHRKECT